MGAGTLGVGGGSLGVLLLGCSPGGATVAAITSSDTAGLAVRASGWFLGDKPKAHLLVVVQGRGQHEGLLQALSTSIAGVVVHYYDVVEIRKIIPPKYVQKGHSDSFTNLSQRST